MLKRIDILGVVGVIAVGLGLLFFANARGIPEHPNIWRDWLLAFALLIAGSTLALAWALIRISSMRDAEEAKEAESKSMAKAAGER